MINIDVGDFLAMALLAAIFGPVEVKKERLKD